MNYISEINKLLEHFKIRPTYTVMNTIYIILKNNGYKDIPRISVSSNILDKQMILNYCEHVQKIILEDPNDDNIHKKKSSKDLYIFQESTLLPQNVYVSGKAREDENLEDNIGDNDPPESTESESEKTSIEEDGYDIYEDEDAVIGGDEEDSQFSD